ncbi:MAG: phosphate ABC transporter permease PstA [Actinobacteria bacterium]|nr:MAG: phosphate ABC transporter permease PstA [Actinomycetota bacterium]
MRHRIDPKIVEKVVFGFLLIVSMLILIPILWVFLITLKNGLSVITWDFLTTSPTMNAGGGIYPAIIGTLLLVVGTVIVSLPIGLGAAIYLSEYSAKNLLTRIIRIGIVSLAGIPSIVYGLFGFAFFVIFLGQFLPIDWRKSLLAGSLTLALMVLPVVITASREALEAVPEHFREVSLSLGATKWQTIRYAVLPHALPGILTGTILGIGRAAGETAPIIFIASAWLARLPNIGNYYIFSGFMALPTYLYSTFANVGKYIENPNTPYGIALVLMILVFIITLPAILIRAKLRRGRKW